MTEAAELSRFVPAEAFALFEEDADAATVDGSLCFVDISGFTALSERLAERGRVGAEELTDVLDAVFGEMIDIAAKRGGMLLKFGGDALLTLFTGEQHALQATSAAVEMRSSLVRARGRQTSVGKLSLRMSQGVHSGSVTLYRVRGTHMELVTAGEAFSEVIRMEGSAEAGEIVVTPATAAMLPPGSTQPRQGNGLKLRWRTPKVDTHAPRDRRQSISSPDSMIPQALCDHLGAGQVESEHRQATVVFVDVVGVDAVMRSHGPAEFVNAVASLVRPAMDLAAAEDMTYLASDVDEDAFKMIFVAGVPTALEDADGRALRLARKIADLLTPFTLKIGVNRGHVFAGSVGSERRATFTIMGDTVNVSARLMSHAPVGGVIASSGVVARSRSTFEVEEIPPLAVKGRTEKIAAYGIGAEVGTRSAAFDDESEFLGRVEEAAVVERLLDGVATGKGASLTVYGPTGIGKSRFVREVLRGASAQLVEVRAEPYGIADPYRPFRDPFRELFGIERSGQQEMSGALARTIRHHMPDLVPYVPLIAEVLQIETPESDATEMIGGRYRQERAADTIIVALDRLLSEDTVIVFEDVQWADAASRHLLARLSAAAGTRSWLVLQTNHDEPVEPGDALPLPPLSDELIEALVHAATESAPLTPGVVSRLVDRAGGNPLFAEELVKAVRESGDVAQLPNSLGDVVSSQIDALEPLSRRVLRYLSVLGRSFRISVARDLIKSQGIELDDATRSSLGEFLDDDGTARLQFRHAVVREAAYEGLSFRRRRELHAAAGSLVRSLYADDEEAVLDVLALHFFLGDDFDNAWTYCLRAGDRNMNRYSNAEAATQFERALAASRRVAAASASDRRNTLVKLGDVRERMGEFGESLDAYKRARQLSGDDPSVEAGLYLKSARARERAGDYAAALGDATRARTTARSTPHDVRDAVDARSLGYSALIRQAQQRPREALDLALEAVEISERANDERALARAWKVLDWAYFMLGQPEKAVYSAAAREIYRSVGDWDEAAAISNNIGGFAYFSGDWDLALRNYEEGRDASARVGNMVDAANAEANIGEVLVNQGRYSSAIGPLMNARRTYRASEFTEGEVFAELLLGRAYGMSGDLEESDQHLERAVAGASETGLSGWELEASVYRSDAICRSGDPIQALEQLDAAVDSAPPEYLDHYAPLIARMRGSILHADGRNEAAREVLAVGLSQATEVDDRYEMALLTLASERLDPGSVPERGLASAQETLRNLGVEATFGLSQMEPV